MTILGYDANPVWQAHESARRSGVHLHCWDGGSYQEHTWDDWRTGAERAAVGLRQLGVESGVRVAAVLTNTFDVCTALVGTWLAGGTLLSLPGMRRGQPIDDYVAQLRRLCNQFDAHVLLLEGRFLEFLDDQDLGAPAVAFDALPADGRFESTPADGEDIAFVQFSSGSTSDPKGCMLSMRAIGEQERMIAQRLRVDETSQGVSWLPMSHDMGLFGCVLLSWTTGMRLVLGPPERFLRTPQTWMEDCARFQATVTVAPNFGLALATRRARTRAPSAAFPLRSLVLGGERIEWPTLVEAHEVLGPYGVTMDTLTPGYGLAEATLAATMKEYDATPHATIIDSAAAQAGELVTRAVGGPGSRELVTCGPPMVGASVRIAGETAIGRICIRSTALAEGYLDDPTATSRPFVDGELLTEDLGCVHEGQVHVLGRVDDVIAMGGRNVHARDVEVAVGGVEGVRAGCLTLIDLDDAGGRRLVLVAEPAPDGQRELRAVSRDLGRTCYQAAAVRIDECVFLHPGTLPKTPSGKIQRFRCRAIVEANADAVLERVAL
jgi:acyl-CoA synthetase (AMP-forming)/AMP-acid ligase II